MSMYIPYLLPPCQLFISAQIVKFKNLEIKSFLALAGNRLVKMTRPRIRSRECNNAFNFDSMSTKNAEDTWS